VPTKEALLREKTYKDQCEDDVRRVFYTLHDVKDLQPHRNSKLLALLVDHLLRRDFLTQDELDEILLDVIN